MGPRASASRLWSAREDDLLCALAKEYNREWSRVAAEIPGRSRAMCRNRLMRLEEQLSPQCKITRRNRCSVCYMLKRGHSCRGKLGQMSVMYETTANMLVNVAKFATDLALPHDAERDPPEPTPEPLPHDTWECASPERSASMSHVFHEYPTDAPPPLADLLSESFDAANESVRCGFPPLPPVFDDDDSGSSSDEPLDAH